MNYLELDGDHLTLESMEEALDQPTQIRLSDAAWDRVRRSREVVEDIVRRGDVVYGVNTGFGKFSDVAISEAHTDELQENLVRSHATGVGDPLPDSVVRTMLLLKANALAKGLSGVRPEIIQLLIDMFRRDVLPVIPEKGSVGASGDLAPLAHLALAMIGEGVCVLEGRRMSAAEALQKAGLGPVRLRSKEGLAVLNGTQAMTAVACVALLRALNLLESADILGAMSTEVLLCTDVAFDARIHEGQSVSAENLRTLLQASPLVLSHRHCKKVQDAYSVRCIPQVHGASRDAAVHVKQVVEREINAATDNPLVFPERGEVLSGGNFHGQPIALVMDYLAIAISELGSISERRVAWMMDASLSDGLPPFLARNGGLHSGYMIAQYTAAALASENKHLCHPASVDSIPTSANKEDHVSMGTIAARKCLKVVENVETILAIEWLCAAQAADFRKPVELAQRTSRAYHLLREHVEPLERDRVTAVDIARAQELLFRKRLVEVVWN